MAKKNALLGGAQIKVENISGFDKSRFNAFTAPLGGIVPMVKQLMIPGNFELSLKISAQLPPLASDAFLRTHLKVEAFLCPLRLCYGGFDSWFSGREIAHQGTAQEGVVFTRAKLPRLRLNTTSSVPSQTVLDSLFGPHSLMDYFGVKYEINGGHVDSNHFPAEDRKYNIFPFLCYNLIYDHWYRNKLIEKPLFTPTDFSSLSSTTSAVSRLPWSAYTNILDLGLQTGTSLLNGDLLSLRYRNYGDDYFTTALPSAQEGNPMAVDTSSGFFTISALRNQNALEHFAEVNLLAGPDMVQVNKARYGVDLSDGVAQRPILLGSADFPMFTSGVEQTAGSSQSTTNPFGGVAARYGRAHAEGSDFICKGSVKEPSYLMVMCSLVPEANYANGIVKDMSIFTQDGSLVDLPVAMLEQTGYEPVLSEEVYLDGQLTPGHVFGYQPRYMWHKAGAVNEIHGLFREGCSLSSFVPQRVFTPGQEPEISSSFLKVDKTDLDGVMAVSGALSQYGVMIDSAISLYVSEPLGESRLPSLVDPAQEHGYTVYVKRGGSHV